ncbi:MAG: hypothetical protein AAFV53_29115 [Myxococcota bacterium]
MLSTILILASLSIAQAGPSPREAAINSRQTVDDRADLRDNSRDYAVLASAVDDWHGAWQANNRSAERDADVRIFQWVKRELADDRSDVNEANRELNQSRRESVGSGPNDQYDRRDDRRDRNQQVADMNRTRAIAAELNAMQPAFASGTASVADYNRKSALLREAQQMALREVREDKEEVRENRRERIEDRRDLDRR